MNTLFRHQRQSVGPVADLGVIHGQGDRQGGTNFKFYQAVLTHVK